MSHGFQKFLIGWFKSRSGHAVLGQEKKLIDDAVENLFGYYMLQFGCVSKSSLMQASRVSHKLIIDEKKHVFNDAKTTAAEQKPSTQWILANLDFLPIGVEKIDVALLPHTLETVNDPYYLLRQVDKMLLPEGHMVITGFNPMGCLSFRLRFFKKQQIPVKPHINRAKRLKEWLEVLGYEVEEVRYSPVMCFSANERYPRWAQLVEKIEKMLQKLGIEFGNVYCLRAKKKVDAPTLVGMKWHLPRWQSIKGRSIATNRVNSKSNKVSAKVEIANKSTHKLTIKEIKE